MLKLLQKPYPLLESTASRWWMSSLFSLFVGLFLYVFQPFGIGSSPGSMLYIASAYAAVCFVLMVLLNLVMVPLLPGLFKESGWTTGHQIFWTLVNVLVIGLGNLLLTSWMFATRLDWGNLMTFEAYTLAIGFFPISVSFVLNQIRLERHYQEKSAQLNAHLPSIHRSIPEIGRVILSSDNQGEQLEINVADFILANAADNYVEVMYLEGKNVRKALLRTTLSRLCTELADHQGCWRCHKSYVVNQSFVDKFSGNAQGYKLHLDQLNTLVPVSRKLHGELHQRFGG
jgi:hypothetical protein